MPPWLMLFVAGAYRISRDWLVLGRVTRPDVRGPAGGAMFVAAAPLLLLLSRALRLLENSCCGTRLPDLLDLLPLLLLLERVRRWELLLLGVVVSCSRIWRRDRSDMLLSRLGVVGAEGEADSPAGSRQHSKKQLSGNMAPRRDGALYSMPATTDMTHVSMTTNCSGAALSARVPRLCGLTVVQYKTAHTPANQPLRLLAGACTHFEWRLPACWQQPQLPLWVLQDCHQPRPSCP